jgi:hypothetical protein
VLIGIPGHTALDNGASHPPVCHRHRPTVHLFRPIHPLLCRAHLPLPPPVHRLVVATAPPTRTTRLGQATARPCGPPGCPALARPIPVRPDYHTPRHWRPRWCPSRARAPSLLTSRVRVSQAAHLLKGTMPSYPSPPRLPFVHLGKHRR